MKIFLLSGKARSGKDTLAHMFAGFLETTKYNPHILRYAGKLKEVATCMGWDGKKDSRGRTLLQKLGTEVGREYDQEIWVRHVFNDIMSISQTETDSVFIIPDFRFPNEKTDLKKMLQNAKVVSTIYTIRIERDIVGEELKEDQVRHPSETALDNELFNLVVRVFDKFNLVPLSLAIEWLYLFFTITSGEYKPDYEGVLARHCDDIRDNGSTSVLPSQVVIQDSTVHIYEHGSK